VKVEINPAGPLEAEVKYLPEPCRLQCKPFFYGTGGGQTTIAVMKVYSEAGKLLHTGLLQVSGKDGHLSLAERTAPVEPLCERPEKPGA
jgi:hypothetical protein